MDIFQHTKRKLSLALFRRAWVETSIKGQNRIVLQQGEFNEHFYAERADFVSCDVDCLNVFVVAESLLETFGKSIA